MTCPHCQAKISFKQRPDRICGLCKKEFAFEPKGHPLQLNDLRFRKVIDRLGAGNLKYTAAQLCLPLRRKPPQPRVATLGIILSLIGLVQIMIGVASTGKGRGILITGTIVIVAGVFLLVGGQSERKFTITEEAFRVEVLERWRAVYGDPPRGLIDETSLVGLVEEDRPRQDLAGVVVCPARDVLTCLLANEVPRDWRLGLLSTEPPADAWEKDLLELLWKQPRLPIFLLHDASAEGVFLARDLPQTLGLKPEHRIYDLGLNPKKSIAKNRQIIKNPVPPEVLARLDREALGADVGGSRPIRRGRAQVTAEEMAWLRAGNCSPILALPPQSLVKRLKFALDKMSPKPKPVAAKKPETPAAVGFLSWPA